jgi:ring-1,2-phenylacetyl-CoA epoxidase subunit PaaC
MAFDDAYESLTDHEDDARWAYGTGFADPLAGVPAAVPDGVDRGDLAAYCLMLGDDALVMSHRLQQWVTRAPELEDEVAVANIALDLLGQARLLLTAPGRPSVTGPTRTRSPISGTPASSATCCWWSGPMRTSRTWWRGCWCSRRGGWPSSTG